MLNCAFALPWHAHVIRMNGANVELSYHAALLCSLVGIPQYFLVTIRLLLPCLYN